MLDVYFGTSKEAICFCEVLFHERKKIELHWKTDEEWGNLIQIENEINSEETVAVVAKAMTEVFMANRLTDFIKEIVTGKYYYSNLDEIERILDLTHWIIQGEDDESVHMRNHEDPRALLHSLFSANVKDKTVIHYDSIVKFRLKVFKDQLIRYIGLAIDEFKREEDHQAFINMLREYVQNKEASYSTIHMIQDDVFIFFKPDGKRFTNMELRMIMQKEPLYIVGLDGDEMNLAPLIAMAPEQIKIYGNDPSEPKTLTVINVFQEKVKFEPYHKFPFPYHLKNQ